MNKNSEELPNHSKEDYDPDAIFFARYPDIVSDPYAGSAFFASWIWDPPFYADPGSCLLKNHSKINIRNSDDIDGFAILVTL